MNARVWTALLVLTLLAAGCAQSTESPQEQKAVQTTPTKTEQATPTQGGNTYMVNIYNGPAGASTTQPSVKPAVISLDGKSAKELAAASVSGSKSDGTGNNTAAADAGYIVSGTTITFSTGAQTPTVSGNTTGTGTQNPAANQTVYPTQRTEPAISAQLGAALPGGSVTQQATPVAGQGTASGQSMTTTNDLKTQLNDLQTDVGSLKTSLSDLISQFSSFLSGTSSGVTSQPAT